MHSWRTQVISRGLTTKCQVDGCHARKRVDRATKRLMQEAQQVEADYLAGSISAKDVLEITAAHYDRDSLTAVLNSFFLEDTVTTAAAPPIPDGHEDSDTGSEADAEPIPAVLDIKTFEPMAADDRQIVLDCDEYLSDVTEDVWVVQTWPLSPTGMQYLLLTSSM